MKAEAQLWAPPEYWDLTPAQRKEVCNGCGTKGLIGFLVPDTIFLLSIKEACNIHDYMYAVGSDIWHKEEADRVFHNNMLRLIDAGTRFNWLKRLRANRAWIYAQVVIRAGGPAFWKGKNKPTELEWVKV